jgi:putative Ig domain-containing protein/cadherin-like protein/peptidase M10/serralysin-like protein
MIGGGVDPAPTGPGLLSGVGRMSIIFTGSPGGRGWAAHLRVSASAVDEDAAGHRTNAALTLSAALSGQGELLLQARESIWGGAGLKMSADLTAPKAAGLTTEVHAAPAPGPAPLTSGFVDAGINAAPTALGAGDLAVIGYNTHQSDSNGATVDSLTVVLMKSIGSGTQIHFTDRNWGGSSFAANGSDGAFTYTAGSDLAAGTVINVALSGGVNLELAGDTIYAYQGVDANTPSSFLYAIDFADGNSTFNGGLGGTGLTVGTSALAIGYDSAAYTGPTTEGLAQYYNGKSLIQNIGDITNWTGDDADALKALDPPDQGGPFNLAPDFSLWSAAGFGINTALVKVDGDATVGGGNTGFDISHLFNNFTLPRDLVFDTVHGKFFVADSNISSVNRILQGNIADLLGNSGQAPTLTVLYQDPGTTTNNQIVNLDVDPEHGIVYFSHGQNIEKVSYDAAGQTPTVLARFGSGTSNPVGSTNNFSDDFVVDYASGTIYMTSHRVLAAQDGDIVSRNFLYKLTGLTPSSGTDAFVFTGGTPNITVMPFSPDDDDADPSGTAIPGEAFPNEGGTLEGLAISPDGSMLYFATASVLFDDDGDGGFSGPGGFGTPPVLKMGGIYSYALTGNAAGTYTKLYQQVSGTGPQGLLDDLEIDFANNRYYVTDTTGLQVSPSSNPPGDEGIWTGSLSGGAITYFGNVNTQLGLTPASLFINKAPTFTATSGTPTVTETAGAGSGFSSLGQPVAVIEAADFENADQTDQLAGAVVRISGDFHTGAAHADRLSINGATSGTLTYGAKTVVFSFDATTGVMTLKGAATFDNYEDALKLVRFSVSGDNPTDYGTAPTRTIAWSITDGLNQSDEQTATVTVSATNDAPVNAVGGAANTNEDAGSVAVTGVSVADPDADPATQDIQVTLSVARGTLTLATNVAGGVSAGDITGNGGDDIVITGTQNEINATLAAVNGLTYAYAGDINGADTLTVTTSDLGQTGTGGALTDSDGKTINVIAVNDAPTVAGDGGEAMTAIAEDAPTAGQSISSLFGGQFSDATDQVSGGSSANGFAGVAITSNPASSNGVWQYSIDGGGSWLEVDSGVTDANAFIVAAGDLLRFAPAADFNGSAPQLTVHLVDDSGGVITSGSQFDLTASGVGGTTRYSSGTVTLDQTVTEVNDAPTATDDTLSDVDEDSAARTISFASLLGNDSAGPANEAGQTLTITGVGNAVGGSVQIVGTDVIFTLDADFNGAASFDYTVADDGTTDGAADPQTDVGTATFNVAAVSDAPSGADKTVTTNEDTDYVFTVADFGFSDPADGDNLLAVIITALPGPGSLELNGVAVTAGQSISATDIAGGLLTYTPGLNATGDAYASLSFQVQDDGGTANGGADTDPTANFITIDVDPLNDDPVVDQGIADQIGYFDEPFSFTIPANAFEDIDGDDLDYTVQLTGGGALPSWLSFNPATGQFSGTPDETEIGTYSIDVTADDGNGGTVTDTFEIEVTGDLVLYGDYGANAIAGHRGDDTVNGRNGNDTLTGGIGRDVLRGQDGNDLLQGGNGGDKLQGGDGNDTLIGGFGRDVYRGGDGDDVFVYDFGDIPAGPPRESIRDFVHGDDVIDLSSIDANGAGPGDTAFTWIGDAKFSGVAGELRYEVGPHGVVVSADTDGDQLADFQLGLAVISTMDATDFIL